MSAGKDTTAAPAVAVVRDQVGVPPCLIAADDGRTIAVPLDQRSALRLAADLLRLAARLEGGEGSPVQRTTWDVALVAVATVGGGVAAGVAAIIALAGSGGAP